jgi:hypothetical protein
LLLARAYRNRPKSKENSILSSEQEMKARLIVMIQEQSSSHPSGRFIFLLSKKVEAGETDFRGHVCVLERLGSSSEGVFFFSSSL